MKENKNTWEEVNNLYMEVALGWLKLSLYRLLASETAEGESALPTTEQHSAGRDWWHILRRNQKQATLARPGTHDGEKQPSAIIPAQVTAANLQSCLDRMADIERGPDKPALCTLAKLLDLTRFEQDILLLCVGMELSAEVRQICGMLNGDPMEAYPTFSIALAALREPTWQALSPEGNLRTWRLVEINQSGMQPLTAAPLRADQRIVNFILGLNYLDDRLAVRMEPVRLLGLEAALPPSQWLVVQGIHSHLAANAYNGASSEQTISTPETMPNSLPAMPVVQLLGLDTPSKQLVAWRAAADYGLTLYRLPVEMIPEQPNELETFARLWDRECKLLDVALLIETRRLDVAPADGANSDGRLARFLSRTSGMAFLDTEIVKNEVGRPTVSVDVGRPTTNEQRLAWADALGVQAGNSPELLAGQFNLSISVIKQIAEAATSEPNSGGWPLHERLWEACRLRTRPRLEALASRTECKARWNDLVLPDAERAVLTDIVAQMRHRGTVYGDWGFRERMSRGMGISVLFAGESGTGKTMAAEVIANELKLDLYQIDLADVASASKHRGDAERRLHQLFEAAEGGGAILCFDQADALFTKRGDTDHSQDCYANIEVGYLLNRIEAYQGLVILTTTCKSALDPAFVHRMRVVLDCPFQARHQREMIWRSVFPPDTPLQKVFDGEWLEQGTPGSDLDYAWLSRLNITGGSIHNIALNAAFLAARNGEPVTMRSVLEAAHAEYRKLERVADTDFGWRPPVTLIPAQTIMLDHVGLAHSY
jgi:hypothetical protein